MKDFGRDPLDRAEKDEKRRAPRLKLREETLHAIGWKRVQGDTTFAALFRGSQRKTKDRTALDARRPEWQPERQRPVGCGLFETIKSPQGPRSTTAASD